MRRGCVAFLALALIAVVLVGCGRFGGERRDPWRVQAEEACLASKLVTPSAYMSRTSEIEGPGACGITYPFKVSAFAGGSVAMSSKVTLGCPMIPEIDGWIDDTLQPAAEMYLGTTVAEIRAGTYSCRGRNGQPGAKISEHAFGNAIDIMSFKLADGRVITVEKGWHGAPEEQDFLRETFLGACRHFTTVLAPGSNVFHYNHMHLDLARHDPRGRRRICQPTIKFEPRLDPDRTAERPAARPRPALRPPPEPEAPLEPLDDEDPYEAARGDGSAPRVAAAPVSPALPVSRDPYVPPPIQAAPRSYGQMAPVGGRTSPGGATPSGNTMPRYAGTPGGPTVIPPGQRTPTVGTPPAYRAPPSAGAPIVLQPRLYEGVDLD